MRSIRRWQIAIALSSVAVLLTTVLVFGFAEESLPFVDPSTGKSFAETEISTVHDDLTYALALAAGFNIADAQTLQIWDQLVDSEQLAADGTVVYSNCLGSFPPPPTAGQVCSTGASPQDTWPMWDKMKDPTSCVTSRYGPYSPFFHFPHDTPGELGAVRDWGWGRSDTLVGYEAYAWGGISVLQATCTYTRTNTIDIGIPAGSLASFATYLHTLGDYYSHKDCLAALDSIGAPWGTHTATGIPECNYHPSNPNDDDAHGREFGTAYPADSARTDAAVQHIYSELTARSLQREGQYRPLALSTPLHTISGTLTLSDTLGIFVHDWTYDQPGERRRWAGEIARAVLEVRQSMHRLYLPLLPDGVAMIRTGRGVAPIGRRAY